MEAVSLNQKSLIDVDEDISYDEPEEVRAVRAVLAGSWCLPQCAHAMLPLGAMDCRCIGIRR